MKTEIVLPLLFSIVAGASISQGQPAGTFTATGTMTTPRHEHTATLLHDGRVLITGGFVTGAGDLLRATDSGELYNPSTGTFARTGSMTKARYEHTATLLPDGRVLIAGGGDASGHLALEAELYDPATGNFTATGSMAAGHWRATLLGNGKVLMALPADASAEIYDPSTGTFTATGGYADNSTLWVAETANLLADGRVLIAGDSTAELYSPVTSIFNLTGTMIYGYAAVGRSATLLTNGKVLFAGGSIDTEFNSGGDLWYPYAELYDPSTGSFTASGNMIHARWAHAATLLPDGAVLITGGAAADFVQSAELYDSSARTFRFIGNMTTQRAFHSATLLGDGRVLIAGGMRGPETSLPWKPDVALDSGELYTPPVLIAPPTLLSLSGDGKGQGAVQHADTYQLVSPSNPAVAEEALIIYCTGLANGSLIPPQVAIGGRMAEVLWFGNTPGFVGLNEINVRMPSGVAPDTAVSVRLNYIGRPANEVTIAVQ